MTTAGDADPAVDVREHGALRDGVPQVLDRRLFMQLLVFDCSGGLRRIDAVRSLGAALTDRGVSAVIYDDLNHPSGLGVLSWTEDPADFVSRVRPAFSEKALCNLRLRPDFTMLGRSYGSGFEPDLDFWLLKRPRDAVLGEDWPWAVWYPLRRSGAFERLDGRERGRIVHEHAQIGRAYGAAGLVHDVRLACHGLDANDNEFIIGLIGKDLHPLSHLMQAMRGTRHTSDYIARLGPFFVGYTTWRNA